MSKNPNIKYCQQCGQPNPKNAKFCSHCGHEFKSSTSVKEDKINQSKQNGQPKLKQQIGNAPTNSSIPSREDMNNTNSTSSNWFSKHKKSWISALIVVVLLCGGTGVGVHHHHTVQQQRIQRQQQSQQNNQSNQNNNQNNNNNNNNQPIPNKQQAQHVLNNFMQDVNGYTHSDSASDIKAQPLAQFYVGGTSNNSFKQMFKWTKNLVNNNTSANMGFNNFHLHKINSHEFAETYKTYYLFETATSHDDETSTSRKKQAVTWHTVVSKDKQDNWRIVKSSSEKDVTTPSDSELSQAGVSPNS